MNKNQIISVFFVILYLFLFYLVYAGQNMLAMYLMAGGMLIEAIMHLVGSFSNKSGGQ